MNAFYHEQLYRSHEVMERIREYSVVVCGTGALGANIAEGLARCGFLRLRLIDHDRIEEHNLSTQPWLRSDIGGHKARVLANQLYRAVGARAESVLEEVTGENAGKLLAGSALVVEAVDTSAGRTAVSEWCRQNTISCLHATLKGDSAEIAWNEHCSAPSPSDLSADDYPLPRNTVVLAAVVACETILRYVATGERRGYTVALRDFAIRPSREGNG